MIKVIASGSKGNCYLIQANEKEKLLIECGIAWKDIVFNLDFNLDGIQGCVVTHAHKDHCLEVKTLIHHAIDIYCHKDVAIKENIIDNRKVNLIESKKQFKIGNFTILPFDCNHTNNDGSNCENLGFIIYHKELGKVLFATDTYYLKYKFNDVDHIFIECNYTEKYLDDMPAFRSRVIKSHMSLETLKETLGNWDLSKTKDITLIHLSSDNSNKEMFKKEIEQATGINTYIAETGLIINEI